MGMHEKYLGKEILIDKATLVTSRNMIYSTISNWERIILSSMFGMTCKSSASQLENTRAISNLLSHSTKKKLRKLIKSHFFSNKKNIIINKKWMFIILILMLTGCAIRMPTLFKYKYIIVDKSSNFNLYHLWMHTQVASIS